MSTAAACERPRIKTALSSIVFGIAALGCMVVPLILSRFEHPTDAKAPMAVVLGIVALALGAVSLVKCGNKLGLLGIVLALSAIGWAGMELKRRVQTDTSGPPPGAEDAMPIEGEMTLDLGTEQETAPPEAAAKETAPANDAPPK